MDFEESVVLIICCLFLRVIGGKCVFKGVGREDVDVRMFGNGRFFILEIKCLKRRNINFEEIVREINVSGKVEVLNLRFIILDEVERVFLILYRKEYFVFVFVKEGVIFEEVEEVVKKFIGFEIY